MMHIRFDDDTGARFAGDRIDERTAIVSLISTPRGGVAQAAADRAATFLREWLEGLPAAVSRVTTWSHDEASSSFLRGLGFADDGERVGGNGHQMALSR